MPWGNIKNTYFIKKSHSLKNTYDGVSSFIEKVVTGIFVMFSEAATRGVLWKKVFASPMPKCDFCKADLQKSWFATSLKSHFDMGGCSFIKKETLAQVFSCEICEIFKNNFFTEHLRWLIQCFQESYIVGALLTTPFRRWIASK